MLTIDSEFRYLSLGMEEREDLTSMLRERLEGYEGVGFAYLFGGFVEREVFRDVDVGVWLRDPEMAWRFTVDVSAEITGDLGVPIDVQVLNRAPLPFRYHVLTEGRLLVSLDEGERLRMVNLTTRMYWDLKLLRKHALRTG